MHVEQSQQIFSSRKFSREPWTCSEFFSVRIRTSQAKFSHRMTIAILYPVSILKTKSVPPHVLFAQHVLIARVNGSFDKPRSEKWKTTIKPARSTGLLSFCGLSVRKIISFCLLEPADFDWTFGLLRRIFWDYWLADELFAVAKSLATVLFLFENRLNADLNPNTARSSGVLTVYFWFNQRNSFEITVATWRWFSSALSRSII